jgi:hypothetical protein
MYIRALAACVGIGKIKGIAAKHRSFISGNFVEHSITVLQIFSIWRNLS